MWYKLYCWRCSFKGRIGESKRWKKVQRGTVQQKDNGKNTNGRALPCIISSPLVLVARCIPYMLNTYHLAGRKSSPKPGEHGLKPSSKKIDMLWLWHYQSEAWGRIKTNIKDQVRWLHWALVGALRGELRAKTGKVFKVRATWRDISLVSDRYQVQYRASYQWVLVCLRRNARCGTDPNTMLFLHL